MPVLERLAGLPVSIDTSRAAVARRALALGATMVNDVTALRRDPELGRRVAEAGATLPDAHAGRAAHDAGRAAVRRRRRPRSPRSSRSGSRSRSRRDPRGADQPRPGIGFGKTPDQNLELLRGLERIVALGRPVLVGLSRKSTLARVARRRGATSGATPPRWAPPSRRSTAERPCSACTTCARTWRRSRRGRRGAGERSLVTIELAGIELHGLHGVLEHERREGQRFLVDLELDLADTRGGGDRPDRGRRRLPRRRRDRRRGLRRRARTTSSRRSRARSRTPS